MIQVRPSLIREMFLHGAQCTETRAVNYFSNFVSDVALALLPLQLLDCVVHHYNRTNRFNHECLINNKVRPYIIYLGML